jgi:hypothetical protein
MGFLKSIQNAVSALIDPANNRQNLELPVFARQEYSPHQQVVGESFRPQNFLALMKSIGAEPDSTHERVAKLELDPENPHNPSGKAVKVLSGGYLLGFIPNTEAEEFFDKIIERGDSALAACEIWFDDPQQDKPRHSVRLILDTPIRFNDEPDPMEGFRNYYYEGLSKKSQEFVDQNREKRRNETPNNFPELNRGSEISWKSGSFHDSDLFIKYLKKAGITFGLSKSRTVLVVVNSREEVDGSSSMDRVLAWDKPIITFEEFLMAYPQLLPPKEKMVARSKALSGIYKDLVQWDIGDLREKVTNKASWKPSLYEGAAYSPSRMLDIGSHKCVNSKDYLEQNQRLFRSVGGSVFDAIVVKGLLKMDESNGRLFVSVQGERLCDVAKSDEEELKSSMLFWQHNNALLQINWIEENKFQTNMSYLYHR